MNNNEHKTNINNKSLHKKTHPGILNKTLLSINRGLYVKSKL